jgi:hypothetical protein
MKMHASRLAGLLTAMGFIPSLLAGALSVAGEWALTTKTKQGDVAWKVVFAQDGETLSVTMTGPKGKEIKGAGSLKEDKIEWSVKVPTPRGEMNVFYAGTVQGEEMSGEVQRGNLGKSDWAAQKKPS